MEGTGGVGIMVTDYYRNKKKPQLVLKVVNL
jgi:hypothetical protein